VLAPEESSDFSCGSAAGASVEASFAGAVSFDSVAASVASGAGVDFAVSSVVASCFVSSDIYIQ
jgi:hypothetical protein